jgi:hypothetical protein
VAAKFGHKSFGQGDRTDTRGFLRLLDDGAATFRASDGSGQSDHVAAAGKQVADLGK